MSKFRPESSLKRKTRERGSPFRKGDVIVLKDAGDRPELSGSVWVVLYCKRRRQDDWSSGCIRLKSFDPRWWDTRFDDHGQWTTYKQAKRFERVKKVARSSHVENMEKINEPDQ